MEGIDDWDKSPSLDVGATPRRSTSSLGNAAMTERIMTFGAACVELGSPLLVAALYWRMPQLRAHLIVLLGALTPAIAIYASLFAAYLNNSNLKDAWWAFSAVWEMSFFPYVATLGAGLAFSFSSRPHQQPGRYVLGLISAPMSFGILVLVAKLASVA